MRLNYDAGSDHFYPSDVGDYEVPDHEWEALHKAIEAIHTLERRWLDTCRVHDDPLGDIVELANLEQPEPIVKDTPEPLTQEIPRNCTVNRGGVHSPVRYGLLDTTPDTGKVGAWCRCGFYFQVVNCPHQQQDPVIRQGNVRCGWCRKVIIGNTGAEEITTENTRNKDPRDLDPSKFRGELV